MAYTQEGIMAQIWIAFGQGAGAIRVSHEAALELQRWYYGAITTEVVDKRWKTDAVQVAGSYPRDRQARRAEGGPCRLHGDQAPGRLRVGVHGAGHRR